MEMHIHPQDVLDALRKIRDLSSQRDIVSLAYVKDIEVTGEGRVSFALQLPNPSNPASQQLIQAAHDAVRALGVANVQIQLMAASSTRLTGPTGTVGAQANLIPQVKHTIAVASGKGGVGKSTVAANLAIALMRAGNQVGLMDTDVYGPSVPILMGGSNEPHVVEGKIEPPVEYGVKIISMAYFLPKDEAVIWRGPMLHKTIQQFLGEVRWGQLDYLVIDLPPGTGDIQLSLSQTIPLSGAVIVSTPQDLALTVASKAIAMFRKLHVPILGVIENMSTYICPQCGHQESIFGHGGARAAAAKMGFAFLGEIPLDTRIRAQSDAGKPVALDDTTPYGKPFAEIAAALEAEVAAIHAEEKIEIE
ncbi:MAG TPA: Mrp/NBP35 family ATP-binding protein [Terriglobia bacterium]|nr:Mrp/NBP35 family ATP-binding protein [Terriglobia bacterium]